MAVTVLVNPYTKEKVESLHILPYTSVNVHVVNSQLLYSMQPMVKAQWSMVKRLKELVKV